MAKTDKELAVELACAYIKALIEHTDQGLPSKEDVEEFLHVCYEIIENLEYRRI